MNLGVSGNWGGVVPYFGVLIIRILLFRMLYWEFPIFGNSYIAGFPNRHFPRTNIHEVRRHVLCRQQERREKHAFPAGLQGSGFLGFGVKYLGNPKP